MPARPSSSRGSGGAIANNPGAQGLIGLSGGFNQNVDFEFGNVTSGSALEFVRGNVEGGLLAQFLFAGKNSFYYQQGITADDSVQQEGDNSQVPAAPAFYDVPGDLIAFARGYQVSDYDAQFVALRPFLRS